MSVQLTMEIVTAMRPALTLQGTPRAPAMKDTDMTEPPA